MSTPARRWSQLHHGIDPSSVPFLRPWLATMWGLARPLVALRVPPTVVTVLGVVLAVDAALLAPSQPWAAGVAVLAAVVCDGLDGAVAVLGDSASTFGARADAIADRIGDVAMAAVIWRCGAPVWSAVTAAALALAVDGLRRWLRTPARITAAERPTWTVCSLLACASASVSDASWPALVCASVWIGFGVIGLVQLVLHRR